MSPDRPTTLRPGVALLSLLALLCDGSVSAAGPRQVVVLYPDGNDGRPGTLLVDRAIRSTFAAGSAERIEVHSEFLDLARFPDPVFQEHLAAFLKRKYAGRKVDLVIAGLAPALDFALRHRDDLFPGVPVVFCAVEQGEALSRDLPDDVVGVPIRMELAATLDLALRLHPDTAEVFVVAGRAEFDTRWEAEARRVFRAFEGRVAFTYLTGLPLDELLHRVSHLPERSVVYYLHVFEDGDGAIHVPSDVAERVAAAANAPVYGHVDTYVGRGVVGGRVFRFERSGTEAAEIGLRLLAGERPEAIPLAAASDAVDLFDWRQLRRWGVAEASLPAGSVVLGREPTFWDQYRWHVLAVVAVCVVEAILIAGLLLQRASRQRAERRVRQVIDTAPTGMLVVAPDGSIVLANAHIERLFGYAKEELLGQAVEVLLPERLRERHARHRAAYAAAPAARAMGAGLELVGRRKDGAEFPVEVGLSPVRLDQGLYLLASVIDVTERRMALESVQESQRELRVLTGKILLAQETERRHIARELHDDLNQRLALLAVELDLLSHEPPETEDEFAERARALAAQVKELSSYVHDLSHQLHPAKLGQLGLLAALRGLCAEVTRGHGLAVDFAHRDVPAAVPEDVALCLYRIAQEALQNVVKHSGCRRAAVEVAGTADALCLRVGDDGAGFDPGTADGTARLGLVSMQERLRLVGGTLAIDSRPGAGTRIEVRVPLAGTTPPSSGGEK